MKTKAYKDGEDAYNQGWPQTRNPYHTSDGNYLDWADGYYDASLLGAPNNLPSESEPGYGDANDLDEWFQAASYGSGGGIIFGIAEGNDTD